MNVLSAKKRQNQWRPEIFYNDLAIDGMFISHWIGQFGDRIEFDGDISELINALYLRREEDTEKVWHYLGQLNENDHYFVPILACPDDLDLTCCVVVAEQFVGKNSIKWLRYGFLHSLLDEQNAEGIEWFHDLPILEFDKQNFIDTFQFFAKEIKELAEKNGEKLNIKMPADPPKEDWELIVDSW